MDMGNTMGGEEFETKNSVTITDNGDGTYSVSGGQEDSPEQMEGNPAGQTAASLPDALKMAGQMLQSGGQGSDRAAIARQVFGEAPTDTGAGQLNRKPNMGGAY